MLTPGKTIVKTVLQKIDFQEDQSLQASFEVDQDQVDQDFSALYSKAQEVSEYRSKGNDAAAPDWANNKQMWLTLAKTSSGPPFSPVPSYVTCLVVNH